MPAVLKPILISIAVFIIAFFLSFGFAFVNNVRLYFYLRKNKYDRWEAVTTTGSFGPGTSNPFRWFDYLFSNTDKEDNAIRSFKNGVKIGLRCAIFFVIALVVNILILFIVATKPRHDKGYVPIGRGVNSRSSVSM
jgi:hypothetical protein